MYAHKRVYTKCLPRRFSHTQLTAPLYNFRLKSIPGQYIIAALARSHPHTSKNMRVRGKAKVSRVTTRGSSSAPANSSLSRLSHEKRPLHYTHDERVCIYARVLYNKAARCTYYTYTHVVQLRSNGLIMLLRASGSYYHIITRRNEGEIRRRCRRHRGGRKSMRRAYKTFRAPCTRVYSHTFLYMYTIYIYVGVRAALNTPGLDATVLPRAVKQT